MVSTKGSTKGSPILLVEACDSAVRPCGCGPDGSRFSLQMVRLEYSLKEKGNPAILEGIFQEEVSHTRTGLQAEGEVSGLSCGCGQLLDGQGHGETAAGLSACTPAGRMPQLYFEVAFPLRGLCCCRSPPRSLSFTQVDFYILHFR